MTWNCLYTAISKAEHWDKKFFLSPAALDELPTTSIPNNQLLRFYDAGHTSSGGYNIVTLGHQIATGVLLRRR